MLVNDECEAVVQEQNDPPYIYHLFIGDETSI